MRLIAFTLRGRDVGLHALFLAGATVRASAVYASSGYRRGHRATLWAFWRLAFVTDYPVVRGTGKFGRLGQAERGCDARTVF